VYLQGTVEVEEARRTGHRAIQVRKED